VSKITISGIKPLSKRPFKPFDVKLDPNGVNTFESLIRHAIFISLAELGYKGLAYITRQLPDGVIHCLYETDPTSPEGVMIQGISNMIAEKRPLPKVSECIELVKQEYIHWGLDLPVLVKQIKGTK